MICDGDEVIVVGPQSDEEESHEGHLTWFEYFNAFKGVVGIVHDLKNGVCKLWRKERQGPGDFWSNFEYYFFDVSWLRKIDEDDVEDDFKRDILW